MPGADLGRSFTDDEIEPAGWRCAHPPTSARRTSPPRPLRRWLPTAIVAWFQGRSEFGPRALGHRSAAGAPGPRPEPGPAQRRSRAASSSGRWHRWCWRTAPASIFGGPIPARTCSSCTTWRRQWRERIPAVVHVDGTARIQTVDRCAEPLLARMLERSTALTGLPVVVNTSLNTAGRPMVDNPRDALECFGSAPVDVLALGPFLLRRSGAHPMSYSVVVPTLGRPSLQMLLTGSEWHECHNTGRPRGDYRGRRPAFRFRGSVAGARAQRPHPGAALWGAGTGSCPQRRLARSGHRMGRLSRRRHRAGAGLGPRIGRRPAWTRARRGRSPRPDQRAAAHRTAADRLGAGTAGLAGAMWITADMAYRRAVLQRSVASTSGSAGRTARTPTWRCG